MDGFDLLIFGFMLPAISALEAYGCVCGVQIRPLRQLVDRTDLRRRPSPQLLKRAARQPVGQFALTGFH